MSSIHARLTEVAAMRLAVLPAGIRGLPPAASQPSGRRSSIGPGVPSAAGWMPDIAGGGVLDHFTLSLGGPEAEESFSKLHADKLFLGVRGIDFDHGLMDTDALRIRLKQTMIQASQEVIVVADSSKIGRPSLLDIASLNVVSAIVTDDGVETEIIDELTKRGIQVYISCESN